MLLPKISGKSEEQSRFFEEVCATYPEVFWMDGCAPPLVRNHKIHFTFKEGAVPVARQPIPLSPYDDMRVEFHIEQNVVEGKLRQINPIKEALPEYSTPVFIVDQDAKESWGAWYVHTDQ